MSDGQPLWREHLGLLVTGGVFVLFVLRLQTVAHGDPTSALAILERSDPATVLLGLAATLGLPFALMGTLVVCATLTVNRPDGDRVRRRALVAAAIALLGLAYLLSWLVAALSAIWLAWLAWLDRDRPGTARVAAYPRLLLTSSLAGAVALLLSVMADDGMWLPRERFTLADGTTFVGYTLDRDETAVTVLRDDDRALVRLAPPAIGTAEYCRGAPEPWWARALVELRATPRYPRCR